LDSGGTLVVAYNDIEIFEDCVLNFYAELLGSNNYLAYAFTFGYRLRMGFLGDIAFSNILSKSKISMFYRIRHHDRVKLSNSTIICLRIIQNYVKRFCDGFGLNFNDYSNDFSAMSKRIKALNCPHLLQNIILKYLSEFSMNISFLMSDSKNLFASMDALFFLALESDDYLLAYWILGNQLNAPIDDYSKKILLNRKSKLESIVKIKSSKPTFDFDFFGSLWKFHEFNFSYSTDVYYRTLRNENKYLQGKNKNILDSFVWLCNNDAESLHEALDLIGEENCKDAFMLGNLIIDNVAIPKDLSNFILLYANKHFFQGNYIRAFYLIKQYQKHEGADNTLADNLLNQIRQCNYKMCP